MKESLGEFFNFLEILFIAGGIAIHFDACSDERF